MATLTPDVGLRARARAAAANGRRRVVEAAIPVLVAAVAAGLAWTFARYVLGQPYPFFAPAAAWISLGFAPDRQVRRVTELAIGVSVGVGLGELLGHLLGVGPWQIGVALVIAALLARFLDPAPLLTAQAGLQAVIVVALPAIIAGGSLGRWIDALVGGAFALLAALLVPGRSWLRARRLANRSLDEVAGTLALLAVALRRGEARRAADALTYARDADPVLDAWRESVATAAEAARYSPVARRHKAEVARLARASTYVDHAMRNARVVSRRAVAALDGPEALPDVGALVGRMALAASALGEALAAGTDPASVRGDLKELAAELQPERFGDGWRVQSVVVLLRSLLVDLLEVSGMDFEQAKAELSL